MVINDYKSSLGENKGNKDTYTVRFEALVNRFAVVFVVVFEIITLVVFPQDQHEEYGDKHNLFNMKISLYYPKNPKIILING